MKKETTAQTMHADEKALDLFADMMIKKIESINEDWHKPWFTAGTLSWPKNLNGRSYNGMNVLMLMMHCEDNGYKIPRFCTFDCVQRLNKGQERGRTARIRQERRALVSYYAHYVLLCKQGNQGAHQVR